ncbi:MAG: 16S rRNA processing protein RimM [Ktedonobacteraceae bacterium]|nr:16S rRNA processing protein RimM [Ktedonobacteraceae bacterium]
MPIQKTTEWATIGKIVAPFGLRGQMKVTSLTDIPDRFAHLEEVYLGSEYKSYTIKEVRPYKGNMVLLKVAGVANATAAEALRNQDVFIPAEQLAKLPPDFYYQHDILGLSVEKVDGGQVVGTIVDIMPTGGNDVYIIKASDGKQYLIPAVKSIIKQVDLIRRVMYIEPIGGMLDDDAVVDEQESPDEEEGEE